MRHRALVFILLAAFAVPGEAAQPVAVVLSQPIDASEIKGPSFEIPDPDLRAAFWTAVADESWADGVTSGRGAEDVFATAPWDEEHRP